MITMRTIKDNNDDDFMVRMITGIIKLSDDEARHIILLSKNLPKFLM